MAKKKERIKIGKAPKPVAARRSKTAVTSANPSNYPAQSLIIRGIVSNLDKTPASGLTVIAFDKDIGGENQLGESVTGEKGEYRIAYTAAQFRLSKNERRGADIFVRVYDTESNLLFQSKTTNSAPVDLQLNVQLPAKQFVVRGQVRFADGSPCAGAEVRAYDKDLRSKEQLGKSDSVATDKRGGYEIAYTAEQFSRVEKRSADLLVEARQHKKAKWIDAPIRFNAQSIEVIDITLDGAYRGPSEFRRMVGEITPLLDGITLAQVTENSDFQDITFLSNETGLDRQRIALLAVSALRSQQQDVLKQEEYYGLFRQSIATGLDALFEKSNDVLRSALDKSARENIVSELTEQALADFVSRVQRVKAGRLLHPSADHEPASLGDLLAIAVDADKRALIAKLFLEHCGATSPFWKALEENSELNAEDVKGVKRVLALGVFTDNYLPLVRELFRIGSETASFSELQGFAQWDETDWQSVLRRPRRFGDTSSEPIGFPQGQGSVESYARTLNAFIAAKYPVAVIAKRIERDNSNEGPFNEVKADLLTFFGNNPEFSFTDMPLVVYLSDGTDGKLRDVENPTTLTAQLMSMQRVLNIVPGYVEMHGLLADDLHSATAIVHLGERQFIERYAELFGGTDAASDTYKKAAHVQATALNVYMKGADAFNSPTPYVLRAGAATAIPKSSVPGYALNNGYAASYGYASSNKVQDFSALFGSLDLCECQHCLSLYSPAAYLVDILKFLRDGPVREGLNPLEVLLTRRPDLEHIELTCDNTNTQLPYVDLVNEILETSIVRRVFGMPSGPDINANLAELDEQIVPTRIREVFADRGYALSDTASVRLEGSKGAGKWNVLDKGWAFSLRFQGVSKGFRVLAWPQTSWTSDELRANPEHTHAPAYTVLQSTMYPWNLPLNLPLEEMRVYLGHLGVQRHEAMETVFQGAAAGAIANKPIVLEYLGFTNEEAAAITGVAAGSSEPWKFWGLQDTNNDVEDRTHSAAPRAQGDWVVVLQRVSIFLQQSGLSYRELLELLGSYFINPSTSRDFPNKRLLGVVSAPGAPVDTCDRSMLEIQIIDDTIADKQEKLAAAFSRMHRLVRLWRKLRWTLRDLDKAITTKPANTSGEVELDDPFLINLSHIQRLHLETGIPVVNLLGWWADIDTRDYIDQLEDGEPAVDSLYGQLFNNKAVSGQVVGDDPIALSGTLEEKAAAIAASLQISVEDFALLQAAIPNDGALTLTNVSLLYRHAALAGATGLTIRTYLTSLDLIDSDPFTTTLRTIQFIKHVDRVRASGFTIEDLDYVLHNRASIVSDIAVEESEIATTLDAMRVDLQKVSDENTFVASGVDDNAATSDPDGEFTRKKLALLNWDSVMIEDVIAVLNGTRTYNTVLASLAPNLAFPNGLDSKLFFDLAEERLRFVGTMTAAERGLLAALPNATTSFIAAIDALFNAPKAFVARYMARFSAPVFSIVVTSSRLKLLLATLKWPDGLKRKIYYDVATESLRFAGVMTDAERTVFSKVSTDNEYLAIIQALFAAPDNSNAPSGANIFLTGADAGLLFDNPDDQPQVRFLLVLKKLLPHLQVALSEGVVKQHLGEVLKLDATIIDGLLKQWIKPQIADPNRPEQRAVADFLDPMFAEASPSIRANSSAFQRQFDSFRLLHRISVLIAKFNISYRQLQWLFEPRLNATWLVLNALPLSSTAATSTTFQAWERLADLFHLRDALPRGEAVLANVFAAAIAPAAQLSSVLAILSEGTHWELTGLQTLSGVNGFNLSVNDLAGEAAILRLATAFSMLKRLGASADQCLSWTNNPATEERARELKSLVRAKYDNAQWLELAKSLRDPLRERQRSALVAYSTQVLGARDASELHDRLLIDVEMGSCMMTTRIKQAIGSVQLFIQRALMNLDDEVALTPKEAQEWSRWRKWNSVWEANRRVLLYPENWIEPELRDDKSPFYKELENELLQSDVTMATAEDAFVHYLEKLDQVARLDIVGMYRQEPEDILHVFGRTYATPPVYFYRRLEGKVWSAWEKVEVDIEGDHLIPITWNRRLYLFWAIFNEKSEQPTREQRTNDRDPNKYWEIKLAWSEYKNGGWSPKKLSRKSLRHNKYPYSPTDDSDSPTVPPQNIPQEPHNFSFKTRTQGYAGDQLSIECYGPTVVKASYQPAPPPTVPRPANVQPIGVLVPHDILGALVPTFIRYKFQLGSGVPNSSRLILQIRNSANAVLESVALNANGYAYATSTYSEEVFGWFVSDDYELESFKEEGSWWTAVLVHVPPHIAAIARAVLDVVNYFPSVNAGATFIATGVPTFGRAITVKLRARTPLPAVQPPAAVIVPTPRLMQGIGEFTLDDCNGDLIAAPLADLVNALTPPSLSPYLRTEVQGMQLVEVAGVNPLAITTTRGEDHILGSTPGTYRLLMSHQYADFSFDSPFFFQDERRTYLVSQEDEGVRFAISFHPRVGDFIRELSRKGVPGLLTLENQQLTDSGGAFWSQYSPTPLYQSFNSTPREKVDFGAGGTYSLYNWELFFHTPFLIATQLSKNQRFEEAQKWFHYIFDPTATDSPGSSGPAGIERFWRVKPFFDAAKQPQQTLEALIADANALSEQVTQWEADPFKPHVIARMRVVAYMKAVVMRYIDNLIEWGDQLFRRDSIESINEATQLYILAGQILGRRPEGMPARVRAKTQTFRTLDDLDDLDSLSNAMVEIESFLAPSAPPSSTADEGNAPTLTMQYFCITGNDKLLGYWDTVSDRLFKIRHCMNIEGVERALPIFDPKIDPAILVRAAAAGVDIASALNDINAPVPHYRFQAMMQKATEFCNDVKSLGGAFLSALEKRDAEMLALLRSSHEVELLKAVKGIKQQQIDEATNTLQGLMQYKGMVTARQQFYLSRQFMNSFEEGHQAMTAASLVAMEVHLGAETLAAVLHLIPNIKTASPLSMGATYGGDNVGPAAQAFGSVASVTASVLSTAASMSSTLAGYERRQEEWTHQADLATMELKQIEKQIAAAEIRLAITENELQNHEKQIENAKEVDDYMRHRKFTNQELYSWMVGQLSAIYFQSYQLAYDVAKRTERAYRYELGIRDSNFVQFGHWDSLKKGLLSGERLHLDLKRMDAAYLDKNKREYEITKHVSLVAIDPISLVKLKETGECLLTLPEALFDIDYPGHYMRRIKSVSVTIPCVTGPYVGINCTLTQLNSSIRHTNTLSAGRYARRADDTRFSDSFGSIQSIVTSSGQNDSGMFEPNLRDERYLPFEGQGAISTWRIQLPRKFKSFDHGTISDVVLHVRYTSREGGDLLRQNSVDGLTAAVNTAAQSGDQRGLARSFSLRHEFPSDWHRFLNPSAGVTGDQTLKLGFEKARFPYLFQSTTIALSGIKLFIKIRPEFATTHNKDSLKIALQPGVTTSTQPLDLSLWNGLLRAEKKPAGALGDWTLVGWFDSGDGEHKPINARVIEDIVAVCAYTIATP